MDKAEADRIVIQTGIVYGFLIRGLGAVCLLVGMGVIQMGKQEGDRTLVRTATIYGMLLAGLCASYLLFIFGVIQKMNKRNVALELIRVTWAKLGKDDLYSTRAFFENRISMEARNKAVKSGLRTYMYQK